jgi:protein-S-isoprenylcysteine O-methyltransferase Ste14
MDSERATERNTQKDAGSGRLRRPGLIILAGSVLPPAIQGLLLFAAAGRFDLPRGWLFVALTFVWLATDTILVAVKNPDLLGRRLRWKRQKGTKSWDRKLVPLIGVFGFYAPPIVIGLDVGRYGWSHLGLWSAILGTLVFSLGWIFVSWAMVVNTHFEVTVRIQADRAHKVVTTGPYAFLRHPGYLGAGLWALGMPLVVGSLYGLIPAAMMIAVLVIRTNLEDQTLQAELPGYSDYAKRVRSRLLPGIW